MHEPTIPDILRDGFAKPQEIPRFQLPWPDDQEAQARCIRLLADMVRNDALTLSWRVQAFELLQMIAREHDFGWGLKGAALEAINDIGRAILSGRLEQPKRGRGRTDNRARDNLIGRAVAWLVFDCGHTQADAIEVVRTAVPRPGGGVLSTERILDVIAQNGPLERYRNQLADAGIK